MPDPNKQYAPFQPTLTGAGLQQFQLSLEHCVPSKVLKHVVHSYLQISAAKATPYPIIPDGTQAIFIGPHSSIIGGAQSQASDLQIFQAGEYFGIRFYPGALRHFFELNLFEITDQFVESHFIPCDKFTQLHNQIYRVHSFQQRANICEQWLLANLCPTSTTAFDQALSIIYQSQGNVKVNQLSQSIGWSSRHLNRQFRYHTGLSTKTFAQTIRLQHACKHLCLNPNDSLTTALNLGFFDQAHLLKDYNKRLLSNPSTFFNRFKSDFYNN